MEPHNWKLMGSTSSLDNPYTGCQSHPLIRVIKNNLFTLQSSNSCFSAAKRTGKAAVMDILTQSTLFKRVTVILIFSTETICSSLKQISRAMHSPSSKVTGTSWSTLKIREKHSHISLQLLTEVVLKELLTIFNCAMTEFTTIGLGPLLPNNYWDT